MKIFVNESLVRAGKNMGRRTILFSALLAALGGGALSSVPVWAAESEGVALAIVYDTSGSMKETVADKGGQSTPKYSIANRALIAIAKQIESFATNSATGPRKIDAGLFVFQGNGARQAIPFGRFDRTLFEDWARHVSNPAGRTPLGNALRAAGDEVLKSPLSHKHVLIITDGKNTAGPDPSEVMPRLKQQAEKEGGALSVHFVAFDVDAKVFDSVKTQGATVVGAANENQLNTQLQFILQRKILLEEEEPPKTKK